MRGQASIAIVEAGHIETSVGQFLRRARIDELPQCLNVLRGVPQSATIGLAMTLVILGAAQHQRSSVLALSYVAHDVLTHGGTRPMVN